MQGYDGKNGKLQKHTEYHLRAPLETRINTNKMIKMRLIT